MEAPTNVQQAAAFALAVVAVMYFWAKKAESEKLEKAIEAVERLAIRMVVLIVLIMHLWSFASGR